MLSRATLLCSLVCLALCLPARAQVQGISYTLSPVGERVLFNDNAGLEDGYLYGGELGFGFGQYVELSALYLFNSNLHTDFSGLSRLSESRLALLENLPARDIKLEQYGGVLKVNLPVQGFVPYVEVGGGVLRFKPETLNSSQTIFLSAGAGVQLSLADRFALKLGVKRFGYRYNLGSTFFSEDDLASVGLFPENFNQTEVANWALHAGLQVYLGGRRPGEETALDRALRSELEGGLGGLTLRGEAFGGVINFNNDLAYRKSQRMSGVNLGLNFGPLVGLRGFYWRGVQDDSFNFDDLQAYGGEIQLNFNTAAQSLSPYILLGGGYMDVLSGYEGRDGAQPSDEAFVAGGAGVVLPLGESLRLKGGIRALLMSTEGADNVSSPSDVLVSPMYSVGLNFVFGGKGRSAADVVDRKIATENEEIEAQLSETQARLARANERIDGLAEALLKAQRGDTLALNRALQTLGDSSAVVAVTSRDSSRGRTSGSYRSDRMVTLPLPEQGELYVRFGDPGGVSIESTFEEGGVTTGQQRSAAAGQPAATVQTFTPGAGQALSAEQIQQIVRQTIREESVRGDTLRNVPSDAYQRRLEQRLDELERALLDNQRSSQDDNARNAEPAGGVSAQPQAQPQAPPRAQPDTTLQSAVTPVVRVEQAGENEPVDVDLVPGTQEGFAGLLPFVGYTIGDANQFALGVRGDLRSVFFSPLRAVPELVYGVGDGTTSYHVSFYGMYPFPQVNQFRPYAGLGLGVLGINDPDKVRSPDGTELTLNIPVGVEVALRYGVFFAEYMMIDFGDFHRFGVGYRLNV